MSHKKILLIFICITFVPLVAADDASETTLELVNPDSGQTFSVNSVNYDVSVGGPSGDVKIYSDTCSASAIEVASFSYSGGFVTETFTHSETYSSCYGEKDWYVKYVGDDGSTKTTSARTFTLESDASQAVLEMVTPSDGASLLDDSVDYEYSVSGPSGTLDLQSQTCSSGASAVVVSTHDYSGGYTKSTYTHSESFSSCYGDKSWNLFYEGDDGSTTSTAPDMFTLQSDSSQSSVTYNSPTDTADISGDTNQEAGITYDFSITGPSGTVVLRQQAGTVLDSWSHPGGSSLDYSYSTTNSVGDYTWSVEYQGDDGSNTVFSTQSYEILSYAERATVSADSPTDGSTTSSQDVTFEYSASGPSANVELYVDGSKVDSYYHPGSTSSYDTHTINGMSRGGHSYYVKYVGDDGSTKSTSTKSFDVQSDAEETTLTANNPADGTTYTGLSTTVTFEGSVSGEPGTVKIFSDTCSQSGKEIYSSSYAGGSSITFRTDRNFDCSSNFDWYIKYIGNDGSTKLMQNKNFSVESDAEATTISQTDPGQVTTLNSGNVTFNFSVSGESGYIEHYVDNNLENNISYNGGSTSSYSKTVEGLSSGSHTWHLEYWGDDGSSKSINQYSFEVDLPIQSDIFLQDPDDDQLYTGQLPYDVRYNFTVKGDNGTVSLYEDGSQITSFEHDSSSNSSYQYNQSFSNEGSHSYFVEYVRDSDGEVIKSSTRNFSISAVPSANISIYKPEDSSSFNKGSSIELKYEVDTNVPGTAEIILNSSTLSSKEIPDDSLNNYTYFDSNIAPDTYSWYVKFNSDDGSIFNSSTSTFRVEEAEEQSGGVGGVIDDDDDTVDNNSVDYNIEFTTEKEYTVAPGSTSNIYFTVWNYGKEKNTVRIETTDSKACSYFRLQSNFVGDQFSKATSLEIPGTQQDLGGGGADVILMAKVELPNKTELQRQGFGSDFTCRFDTSVETGQAEPLNITVNAVDTTPEWLKAIKEMLPEFPDTALIESEDICLTSDLKEAVEFRKTGKCGGQLQPVPIPTGDAAALIFGVFVFIIGVRSYRGRVI
jgi:hypothetical protein